MVRRCVFKNEYPTDFMKWFLGECRKRGKAKEQDQGYLNKLLNRAFRYATDAVYCDYYSDAALAKADKMGVDLTIARWANRDAIKENGKKVFHLDHCNPVTKLAARVLETDESIDDIIKDNNMTAWILNSENNKLDKQYKSDRPNGWEKCYAEYGITFKHRDDVK